MDLTRGHAATTGPLIDVNRDDPDKAVGRWPEEWSSSPLWDFPWHA